MPSNKKLLILPGDGIGPEVMREVRRVIDWMDRRRMVSFDVSEDLAGGASISVPQKRGTVFVEAGMTSPDGPCRAFDAGVIVPLTGPQPRAIYVGGVCNAGRLWGPLPTIR